VHELENVNSDRIFVSRTRTDIAGGEFDDILTWIPAAIVISRLVGTGQLP
jgi:hypothetical protein